MIAIPLVPGKFAKDEEGDFYSSHPITKNAADIFHKSPKPLTHARNSEFLMAEKHEKPESKKVALKDLTPTQNHLYPSKLNKMNSTEPVSVHKVGETHYLRDGHHRAAKAILKGDTHIDADVGSDRTKKLF